MYVSEWVRSLWSCCLRLRLKSTRLFTLTMCTYVTLSTQLSVYVCVFRTLCTTAVSAADSREWIGSLHAHQSWSLHSDLSWTSSEPRWPWLDSDTQTHRHTRTHKSLKVHMKASDYHSLLRSCYANARPRSSSLQDYILQLSVHYGLVWISSQFCDIL